VGSLEESDNFVAALAPSCIFLVLRHKHPAPKHSSRKEFRSDTLTFPKARPLQHTPTCRSHPAPPQVLRQSPISFSPPAHGTSDNHIGSIQHFPCDKQSSLRCGIPTLYKLRWHRSARMSIRIHCPKHQHHCTWSPIDKRLGYSPRARPIVGGTGAEVLSRSPAPCGSYDYRPNRSSIAWWTSFSLLSPTRIQNVCALLLDG
jgi:hypothetical protein